MIKIDITNLPFMMEVVTEADQWMNDNVGEMISSDLTCTTGKGWKIYVDDGNQFDKLPENRRWYAEFESEKDASWFLLRWS